MADIYKTGDLVEPKSGGPTMTIAVPRHVQQFVEAFGGIRPFPLQAESVKPLRSLQVAFAQRFVFVSRDNFDLAREMLRATSKFKTDPRSG
jgi:hypothetical protein